MSESFKIEHRVNRRFQEGRFCGSVITISVSLPQKDYRRDGLGPF